MLSELAQRQHRWEQTTIFQVDERAVPEDDDLRNLKHIKARPRVERAPRS